MAQLRAAPPHQARPTAPSAFDDDPRWRNDASFTVLVAALLLMVLTLVFWVA